MFVSRKKALQRQTRHQFMEGIGFLEHDGPPDLPDSAKGDKNCRPLEEPEDGSLHLLQPPGKHPPMRMRWVAAERAWASILPYGNRLAWTCDHLMKAGWEYIGPCPPAETVV